MKMSNSLVESPPQRLTLRRPELRNNPALELTKPFEPVYAPLTPRTFAITLSYAAAILLGWGTLILDAKEGVADGSGCGRTWCRVKYGSCLGEAVESDPECTLGRIKSPLESRGTR